MLNVKFIHNEIRGYRNAYPIGILNLRAVNCSKNSKTNLEANFDLASLTNEVKIKQNFAIQKKNWLNFQFSISSQ